MTNPTLDIATGISAGSRIWKNKKIQWIKLVEKLSETTFTSETYKEYLSYKKEDQSKIKDVGGFVGGYLRGGRRNPDKVLHRQILTLDLDFASLFFWDDFQLQFGNAAVIHSTHKHSDESPRYRLIIPLKREVTSDEYLAVSRSVAGSLGIHYFDNTTFEVNRLMFWPSTSKDSKYYFKHQKGELLDPDEILDSYIDWTDSTMWPTNNQTKNLVNNKIKKQEDPEEKKNIVGLFCRTYSITDAIDKFLKEIYTPTSLSDRFTYSKGSTSAGLIVYEDKFAYSHHGTDPVSGALCNSFDLVRIHKFGYLDDNKVSGKGTKSYKSLEKLILEDENIKVKIARENIEKAKYDFGDGGEEDETKLEVLDYEDTEWLKNLEINNRGEYVSNAPNLNIIFMNDPKIKKTFRNNEFNNKRYVFNSLPWRKIKRPEPIKNVDYSGTRNYIESIYNIVGNLKIDDAMALEFERNNYHPVLKYLSDLEWDGVKRIDTLLIDYLGAKDTEYCRNAIRKTLIGAATRIFEPGCKFDLVLTLIGKQGTGKSTFFKKLGKEWFSDTFLTVQGKEALEQIQGAWIIEMAELSGLKKAETESIKHFISKQEDTFRPAYARSSETFRRQCIFVGTTNNRDFLKDPTGNRRFLPVDIDESTPQYSIFSDKFDSELDQIWAEAVDAYKKKETVFLSSEVNNLAIIEQKKYIETDERVGLIENYLDTKLPDNWKELDIYERRTFLDDPLVEKGTNERGYVCVAEVWTECLRKEKEDMDRYKTRDINEILRRLDDWEYRNSTKNFPLYGKQKFYLRKLD